MPIYEYEKSGKTHYYYAFEVKEDNGKRKTIKKQGFKTKREARDAEAEARDTWNKGNYIDPSKTLYTDYVVNWLENKQDISNKTRYVNEGHIKNHIIPELGHLPLQKINVIHIENFIKSLQSEEKNLAAGTIKKIFNLVQTSFNAAEKKELLSKNPFNLLDKSSKPKAGKPKVDYWTKEEAKQFLDSFEHRNKIIFILAIYTGMRQGEILGLRWRDIDFENGQLRIRQILDGLTGKIQERVKTDAGYRSVTMSNHVMSELKKHRAAMVQEKLAAEEYFDQNLVICQPNGKPVGITNFHKFWVRKLDQTGVRRIRFHDLRHTCASLLFSAGVHPKVVQELLGHKSIKVTLDTYSHMLPNMQKDALKELDKMLQ